MVPQCEVVLKSSDIDLSGWRIEEVNRRLLAVDLKQVRDYSQDESYGVVHIYIRLGLTTGGHVLGGLATLGLLNLLVEKDLGGFHSVHKYFDSKTEKFLAHDKDEAAQGLYQIGLKYLEENRHLEAYDYLNNAYNYCTRGYKNEHLFKSKRDGMEELINRNLKAEEFYTQGMDAFNKRQYTWAKELFDQALNYCLENYRSRPLFLQRRKEAEKKIEDQVIEKVQNAMAERSYLEGMELFVQGQYSAAHESFDQAFNKCTPGYGNKSLFAEKRKLAETELQREDDRRSQNENAELIYSQALELLEQENYKLAQDFFIKASMECTQDYENKPKFKEKQVQARQQMEKLAQQNVRNDIATRIYHQALKSSTTGNLQAAIALLNQALEISTENFGARETICDKLSEIQQQLKSGEVKKIQKEKLKQAFTSFLKGKLLEVELTPGNISDLDSKMITGLFRQSFQAVPTPESYHQLQVALRIHGNEQSSSSSSSSARSQPTSLTSDPNYPFPKDREIIELPLEESVKVIEDQLTPLLRQELSGRSKVVNLLELESALDLFCKTQTELFCDNNSATFLNAIQRIVSEYVGSETRSDKYKPDQF